MLQWSAMFIDHCIFWRQYWMFITHCILCRNLVFWKKYCMIDGLIWLWREDCTATGVGCPSLQGFGITNQFTNRNSTHPRFDKFPKISDFLCQKTIESPARKKQTTNSLPHLLPLFLTHRHPNHPRVWYWSWTGFVGASINPVCQMFKELNKEFAPSP